MGKGNDIQFNITSRNTISEGLKNGKTATEIGLMTRHHKSSVSREVFYHRHLYLKAKNDQGICSTCCAYRECKLRKVCGSLMCQGDCRLCHNLKTCSHYKPIICKIQTRWPFICSSNCPYISYCGFDKYEYLPEKANEEAQTVKVLSRAGLDMTATQFKEMDDAIYNGVKKGQSINHICSSNSKLIRSKSSVYRYVHEKYLRINLMDLPKAVTYKTRNKTPSKYEYGENINVNRKGHEYYDWIVFKAKNRIVNYWQMDFLGATNDSEQEILTLVCPSIEFLLMFVFDRPITQESIVNLFDTLEYKLGLDLFKKVFEAILTDRDPRFNNFNAIEANEDAEIRTRLFYCDPSVSNEKPLVENENSQIRTIFPKGMAIKNLSQEKLTFINNNFDSRLISSLQNHTAIEAFIEVFGEEALIKLGISIINPDDVTIKKYTHY